MGNCTFHLQLSISVNSDLLKNPAKIVIMQLVASADPEKFCHAREKAFSTQDFVHFEVFLLLFGKLKGNGW